MFFVSPSLELMKKAFSIGWMIFLDHILSFWTFNIAFLLLFLFCDLLPVPCVSRMKKGKMCLNCYLSVYSLPFTIFNNSIAQDASFFSCTAPAERETRENLNMTRSIYFLILESEGKNIALLSLAWHNDLDKLLLQYEGNEKQERSFF